MSMEDKNANAQLSENIIQLLLKKEYECNIKQYGETHILGTFVVGMANYGFAEKPEELRFVTVYIPSFEELCFGTYAVHNNHSLYDIRDAYVNAIKKGFNGLELLFSNYYIINPTYKEIFQQDLLQHRELIAKINVYERFFKAYIRIKNTLEEENYFEAMRLAIAIKLFAKGESAENCYHIKDDIYINFLWNCKKNLLDFDIDSLLNDLYMIIKNIKQGINMDADKTIKHGVVNILTKSLNQNIPIDNFFTCLTSTEKKAWKFLQTQIKDNELSFSISKLIEQTKISRPVWKSLLDKMEKSQIAFVQSCGVKGTKIKIRK